MLGEKIGIIGFGNMGSAIAERIKDKYPVYIFEKDAGKASNVSADNITDSISGLLDKVNVVILAVKPQDFDPVLGEAKKNISRQLVISIAAGIPTGYIEKFLGQVRVIRVMPNICARIGMAESSLCKGKFALDTDLNFVKELFGYLGKTWIMKEEMIDAATAISGSGPAYIYYDMEIRKYEPGNLPQRTQDDYVKRLTKAAERVGFERKLAGELASSTIASSLEMARISLEKGLTLIELRRQITSKGGTTEAGLRILDQGGSWWQAAEAAMKRAKELSKK